MRLDEVDFIGKYTPKFNEIMRKHRVAYIDLIKQLAKGIRVEMEHTQDMALAREIALDHLAEFPDYYTRLAKAEQK